MPGSKQFTNTAGAWFAFCCLPLIGLSVLHMHRPLLFEIPYEESSNILAINMPHDVFNQLENAQCTVHPNKGTWLLRRFFIAVGSDIETLRLTINVLFVCSSFVYYRILLAADGSGGNLPSQGRLPQDNIAKSLFTLAVYSSPLAFAHSYSVSVETISIFFVAAFCLCEIQQSREKFYCVRPAFWLIFGISLSLIHVYGTLLVACIITGSMIPKFCPEFTRSTFQASSVKKTVLGGIAVGILASYLLVNFANLKEALGKSQSRYWSEWIQTHVFELPMGALLRRAVGMGVSSGMCCAMQFCVFAIIGLSLIFAFWKRDHDCNFQTAGVLLVLTCIAYENIVNAPFLIVQYCSPFILLFGMAIFSAVHQIFGSRGVIALAIASIFLTTAPMVVYFSDSGVSNKRTLAESAEYIEAELLTKEVVFVGSRTYVLFAPYLSQNALANAKVCIPRSDRFFGANLIADHIIRESLPAKLNSPTSIVTLECAGAVRVDVNNYAIIKARTFHHQGPIIGVIGVYRFAANEAVD